MAVSKQRVEPKIFHFANAAMQIRFRYATQKPSQNVL